MGDKREAQNEVEAIPLDGAAAGYARDNEISKLGDADEPMKEISITENDENKEIKNIDGTCDTKTQFEKIIVDLDTGIGGAKRKTTSGTQEPNNKRSNDIIERFENLSIDDAVGFVVEIERKFERKFKKSEWKTSQLKAELDDAKRQNDILNEMNYESKQRFKLKENELHEVIENKKQFEEAKQKLILEKEEELTRKKLENDQLKKNLLMAKNEAQKTKFLADIRLKKIDMMYKRNHDLYATYNKMKEKMNSLKSSINNAKDVLLSKIRYWKPSTKQRKVRAAQLIDQTISDIPSFGNFSSG